MLKQKKTKLTQTRNEEAGIESRFVDVNEMDVYFRILLYGRSGTGKTHFIGTAPKPILILDVRDKGTKTLFNQKDIKVLPVQTWADVEEVYWYLVGPGKGKFATIAIDTLTQLQDMALKQVRQGDETSMISRRAWGEAAGLLKTWMMNYRDLDMNVIFTAQDRADASDEIDEDGAILPEVGPYLMPSVAKIANAAVDVIGNTFIREREKKIKVGDKTRTKTITEYCMRLGPHARYITKIRRDSSLEGDGVPSIVVNPSFGEVLKISIGGMSDG